ncbi:trypsin, alkaline B-like isoform X3 [Vanessa cardui]|uniref:trypsin, alkaline B-like isoform X2 n=1 Tax=Vanessa cardui TaxID=171605 RepID=UPI001F1444C1|nr:trypsin, alkaline B-like isoform X2 [Vanessa cardui]XP_046961261.1 trypsin, alkaline B-like isoform X3 [Vanessa cardui]
MRSLILLFALCLTAVSGIADNQRIIGGSLTTIQNYPFAAVVLRNTNQGYTQACGGVILNNRSVVSVGHCFYGTSPNVWRIRVGSSYASSGGSTHNVGSLIIHPDYNNMLDNDIGIFRVSSSFSLGGNVQPGRFAGPNYNVADGQAVWTAGWGAIYYGGPRSEQLRHVQIFTVNYTVCRRNYNIISVTIPETQMCAGILDQGGRDFCEGDYGGPLVHNGVVVGISTYGFVCGRDRYPGVYSRVSSFINWIQNNA